MSSRSSRAATPSGRQKQELGRQNSLRSRASSVSSNSSRGSKRSSRRRRRKWSNASGSSMSDASQERASESQKAKASMRGKNQFGKITALIKDKERRKKKEKPDASGKEAVECFVDSSRAALAVGAKDLRGEILKHRHRLKNEEDADDTDSPAFLLLIEQAEWDMNIKSPWTAVKYLNRASTIVPDDIYVLTLRAHAKLGCQDYEGALEDANRVLEFLREPDNPGALIAKGDAFYFLGKFEHALVNYYRAEDQDNLLTKESDHLVNVIARAKNAILNAVGESSETFTSDIKSMVEEGNIEQYLKDDSTEEEEQDQNFIPTIVNKSEQIEKEKQEDIQLLEEFAADKAFLENILDNISDNPKIKQEVDDALKFLTQRKHFWKQHGTHAAETPGRGDTRKKTRT